MTEFVQVEQNAVHIFEQDKADFDNFAAVIRKYVGVKELTPTIVNEFVKKIIVHAPDKSSGHRRQKVQIIWNFIGKVNLPNDGQVIERQRRQNGIATRYAALQDTITSLSLLKTPFENPFCQKENGGRNVIFKPPLGFYILFWRVNIQPPKQRFFLRWAARCLFYEKIHKHSISLSRMKFL